MTDVRTVSESERMIPLSYDVDVIVIGGTLRGVAAAQAAAKAGCKVFLCEDRPYLGVDVCGTYRLWLEEGEQPETPLGRSIYGDASEARATDNGYLVVTPMHVKKRLDDALLRSKVDFLYGSYVTEVLRDPDATMWDLRFASHALAFSPAEGLEPFLTERARNLSDEGARANLAFGLAQRGVEEGVQLYFEMTDAVFERKDPVARGTAWLRNERSWRHHLAPLLEAA